jgi:hypothetical protein
MVGAGAAVGGLSVALGGGDAAKIISVYHTGVAGQAGITLVSVAYAVNAAIWAAAYLLGPGFALGDDSVIRLTEFSVGDLPAVPLLAGLPNGPMGSAGTLLLMLPALAGGVAGWGLTQRIRYGRLHAWRPGRGSVADGPEPAWSLLVGAGLVAGPVAGLVMAALVWCSGGPIGAGRLSQIGRSCRWAWSPRSSPGSRCWPVRPPHEPSTPRSGRACASNRPISVDLGCPDRVRR